MAVVSAFLVPGSPLPYLKPENPPWHALVEGYKTAGAALAESSPDVILVYSTQWVAVLDQLWQTKPRVMGLHVDENWYEYGDLPFDLTVDTELAQACVVGSKEIGVGSKGVNYDGFPVDTGTIVMANFLNPGGGYPLVIASNNIYHNGAITARLAAMAVSRAQDQKKEVAVVGVGGLSGTIFRTEIDISEDHIANENDNMWNKKILAMMENGDVAGLRTGITDYAKEARVDMGFKHFWWLLGALGGSFAGAKVHAYGPSYGSGCAIVELKVS